MMKHHDVGNLYRSVSSYRAFATLSFLFHQHWIMWCVIGVIGAGFVLGLLLNGMTNTLHMDNVQKSFSDVGMYTYTMRATYPDKTSIFNRYQPFLGLEVPLFTMDYFTMFTLSEETAHPVTDNSHWTPIVQEFNGIPMLFVPTGCFQMGTNDQEVIQLNQEYGTDWFSGETPQHEQCFRKGYWIDQTEVTQVDFERLGGVKAFANEFDNARHPVENITWFEARDFCVLRGGRLPTEAEWEYAARGPDGLRYPWGDVWNPDNAVWGENSSGQTSDVGSRPDGVSWVGALDMSGNVWEWVNSVYESYPYSATDGREQDADGNMDIMRVVRGGSWNYSFTFNLRGTDRYRNSPDNWFSYGGFRCARSG